MMMRVVSAFRNSLKLCGANDRKNLSSLSPFILTLDHTAHHLTAHLKKQFPGTALAILGRGLSTGSELEYSDPDTLTNALTRRSTL